MVTVGHSFENAFDFRKILTDLTPWNHVLLHLFVFPWGRTQTMLNFSIIIWNKLSIISNFLAFSGCVHATQNLSSMGHNGLNQKWFWSFSEEKKVLLKKVWKLWDPLEICERFTKLFLDIFIFIERKPLILAIKNHHFRAENHFYFPFKNHGF